MGAFKMKAQRCEKCHKIWGSKTHKTIFDKNNTNNETVHAEKLCVISDYSYILTFMISSKVLLTQIQRIRISKQLRLFPSTHIFFELKFLDSCLIFLLPHRNYPSES